MIVENLGIQQVINEDIALSSFRSNTIPNNGEVGLPRSPGQHSMVIGSAKSLTFNNNNILFVNIVNINSSYVNNFREDEANIL